MDEAIFERGPQAQISIHPGVVRGRRVFPLTKNTRPHKGKGKLAKKMKRLHLRRLSHAATIKGLPATVNPTSYKAPGSMHQGK